MSRTPTGRGFRHPFGFVAAAIRVVFSITSLWAQTHRASRVSLGNKRGSAASETRCAACATGYLATKTNAPAGTALAQLVGELGKSGSIISLHTS